MYYYVKNVDYGIHLSCIFSDGGTRGLRGNSAPQLFDKSFPRARNGKTYIRNDLYGGPRLIQGIMTHAYLVPYVVQKDQVLALKRTQHLCHKLAGMRDIIVMCIVIILFPSKLIPIVSI